MDPQVLEHLKESAAAFNRWREKNPVIKIDLEGADLSDRNLAKVNLAGANLLGVSFRNASLESAVFKNADVSGADFTRAHLERAIFDYAKGLSSVFAGAQALDASFIKGTFQGCDFREADLRRTLFTGSDIGHSNFTGAVVTGGNFDKTNLSEAVFVRHEFESVVLPFDSVFSQAEKNRTRATVSFLVFFLFTVGFFAWGFNWIAGAGEPGALNSKIRSHWLVISAKNAEIADYFEADRAYRLAVKLNPGSEEILWSAAQFFEKRDQGEKAYHVYKKMLELPVLAAEHRDRARTFVDNWER